MNTAVLNVLGLALCVLCESSYYFYATPASLRRFNPATLEDVAIISRNGVSNTAFDSSTYRVFFRSQDEGITSMYSNLALI